MMARLLSPPVILRNSPLSRLVNGRTFYPNYSIFKSVIGCAHSQQVIWQMFNAVEKGFLASGDPDVAFLQGAMLSVYLK